MVVEVKVKAPTRQQAQLEAAKAAARQGAEAAGAEARQQVQLIAEAKAKEETLQVSWI